MLSASLICLDDSSSDYDVPVASKRLLFHKQNASFPQGVSAVDHQNPTLNHFQNVINVQEVKTGDSSDNCDVSWEFQCKFPIYI